MRKSGWPKISLATKCRILFGVAVLLILTATLYLPWLRMDELSQTSEVRGAQQIALAARLTANVDFQDWDVAQVQLNRDWATISPALVFQGDPPNMISIEQEAGLRLTRPKGFLLQAILKFRKDPQLRFVHKFHSDDEGRWVRVAMPVRTLQTDPEPNRLRGIIHVRMPIQNENRYWSTVVLILAGLSGSFLAMLVFYLVTQRLILSPVRDLRAIAEQVTDGDINVRANITTGDEFEDLADAFNEMLLRIKQSHDELRTINRSLDVKLGELAETNVTLYEANRLKTEFIANVSHELRTPMGLIINFAELLRDALEDPPEDMSRVLRYTQNILRAGRSLLDIINDLLDLAKIEAGKVELHLTEFSMVETCSALVDLVRPQADKKHIELEITQVGEPHPMHSDSGKVKQILYNLLSNAVKFTPEQGSITLQIAATNAKQVRVRVSDTGPGIEPDQFELIFEKFRQIDSSLTREHGGAGLGLAITKELVHMLGGSISVQSQVGRGSTFTVTLPFVAPQQKHQKLISLND